MEDVQEKQENHNPTRNTKEKKEIPFLLKLVLLIALIFFLRTFVMGTVSVKGSSMEPSFHHGDIVFVNKLATTIGSPERGDIVICNINTDGYQEKIIKRVIGEPGDEINIVPNADSENEAYALYVNGDLVEETFLREPMMTAGDIEYPFAVPEGAYFVMGDNRNASSDSRRSSIGAIAKTDLDGKVVFRLYPLDGFGTIS